MLYCLHTSYYFIMCTALVKFHLQVCPNSYSVSPNKWLLGCSISLGKDLSTETWQQGTYLSLKTTFARYIDYSIFISLLIVCVNNTKIADFGLSRDLMKENYYISHGGKVPVKWTAPEAIHFKKYSTASDVWSYGCLLYEIWTLGRKPFEKFSNIKVCNKLYYIYVILGYNLVSCHKYSRRFSISQALQFVANGKRLSSPSGCPRAIYSMMIQCW